MSTPIDGLVYFTVNASFAQHRDGHWRAITSETGLVTYGATEDEALAANQTANLILVRSWKRRGVDALARFMAAHGITYRVEPDERPQPHGTGRDSGEWTHSALLPIAA